MYAQVNFLWSSIIFENNPSTVFFKQVQVKLEICLFMYKLILNCPSFKVNSKEIFSFLFSVFKGDNGNRYLDKVLKSVVLKILNEIFTKLDYNPTELTYDSIFSQLLQLTKINSIFHEFASFFKEFTKFC